MISVDERVLVDAPIDAVWSHLREPAGIVQCIPGAALSEERADGSYLGTLTVAFGPTRVKFQGAVALEYRTEEYLCRAKSRGRDQRGLSNAIGEGVFSLEPAGSATTLHVSGSFALTGPLAPFAKTGGHSVPTLLRRQGRARTPAVPAEGR
jgi:carbon monoxide dehydrogenase subunit G